MLLSDSYRLPRLPRQIRQTLQTRQTCLTSPPVFILQPLAAPIPPIPPTISLSEAVADREREILDAREQGQFAAAEPLQVGLGYQTDEEVVEVVCEAHATQCIERQKILSSIVGVFITFCDPD